MNPLIKPYIPIAKIIVETFGTDCEVVIHDLSNPEHSVVYVENPVVTKREVGQSFDHIIKQVIYSKKLKDDYVCNYYFKTTLNVLVRSSTLLIRDENNKLVGALCINIDTTKVTKQIDYLKAFLPNRETTFFDDISDDIIKNDFEVEDDNLHVNTMITSLIDNILKDCNIDILTRDERIEKIRFMDKKGIFLMKGSVEEVAKKMNINKVTVYSYLDIVRGKRK
ncbi:MAG: helix-turn-helix transcriptional regulator [Pleomorphochaeta sp.]